jgi:hypothetical protein
VELLANPATEAVAETAARHHAVLQEEPEGQNGIHCKRGSDVEIQIDDPQGSGKKEDHKKEKRSRPENARGYKKAIGPDCRSPASSVASVPIRAVHDPRIVTVFPWYKSRGMQPLKKLDLVHLSA